MEISISYPLFILKQRQIKVIPHCEHLQMKNEKDDEKDPSYFRKR